MKKPRKIRVLYFDEYENKSLKFAERCKGNEIIDIVASFGSFLQTAPIIERDNYHFFEMLSIDVVVIRTDYMDLDIINYLKSLKKHCHVKIVGLLGQKCINERGILSVFDYNTQDASADNLITEDDAYAKLFYNIKTARLIKNIEQSGIKGKWAILPIPDKKTADRSFEIIVIGASAGGTEAVSQILASLPSNLPPIVIVQHIPDNFAEFFAGNLDAKISARVVVARGGEKLENSVVYLAGYNKHLEIVKDENGQYYTQCINTEKVSGHCPSVDVLFSSVSKAAGSMAIGIILTGMGSDGALGLLEMRKAGAYTIGQDKESCAVYGMPMAAYSLGAVSKQLPLCDIAKAVLSAVGKTKEGER